MNIESLATDLASDAAWATVQAAHQQVINGRRERQKLERALERVRGEESDALTRLTAALTVIKNRQEGKS
jgi:hypothetical protein